MVTLCDGECVKVCVARLPLPISAHERQLGSDLGHRHKRKDVHRDLQRQHLGEVHPMMLAAFDSIAIVDSTF
jgi:hypothetical protein